MAKVLFTPFSVIGSLLAGLAARKAFDQIWQRIDEEDPPKPAEELEPMQRILLASALQALVFAITKSLFDRGARRTFRGLTGTWPGPKDKT